MSTPADPFTSLFEPGAPALPTWIRLRLVGNPVEAEDVLQEIWLRGSKEFPRYDPERGSFRTWIFQVAKFAVLDTLRDRTSPRPLSGLRAGANASSLLGRLPDEVTTLTSRLARDESHEKLLAELGELEHEERELVVICGLEGRASTDAAHLLGISPETSRKRWQRLRQRLAQNPRILALIEPEQR